MHKVRIRAWFLFLLGRRTVVSFLNDSDRRHWRGAAAAGQAATLR
jgi:hypothetical protein